MPGPPLVATLRFVAAGLRDVREPWWIIGSAAVALHGGDTAVADVDGDVDVLTTVAGARDLCAIWGRVPQNAEPHERFASVVFERFTCAPLAIEVMGALSLRHGRTWQPVVLRTRQAIAVAGSVVYVPERAELVSLLNRFGRAKDVRRANLL